MRRLQIQIKPGGRGSRAVQPAQKPLTAQRQRWLSGEGSRREVVCEELGPGRRRDHSGVVGRKSKRWKGDGEAAIGGFSREADAQFAIRRDTPGDQETRSS